MIWYNNPKRIKRIDPKGCTHVVLDQAAKLGRVDVVKRIHENRDEVFTLGPMITAAENGHLGIVKWLHKNRDGTCTAKTMQQPLTTAPRYSLDLLI